tara:strand:+ start:270 stop:545 length:276 start_codon:yes stop_codon:yes gene_type:complete
LVEGKHDAQESVSRYVRSAECWGAPPLFDKNFIFEKLFFEGGTKVRFSKNCTSAVCGHKSVAGQRSGITPAKGQRNGVLQAITATPRRSVM